jgi:type II secretory ATPase GspE/PulE/Tfp pilus assembly ATPase PilB-like protein
MSNEARSAIEEISTEEQIPKGYSIVMGNSPTDIIKLTDSQRKELIVLDYSQGRTQNVAFIFSVKQSYGNNTFKQVIKLLEEKNYRIFRKGVIDANLLNNLYNKKLTIASQDANKSNSQAIELFEVILSDALAGKVSDIHLEVRPNGSGIRMRQDGDLRVYELNGNTVFTYEQLNNVCSVMYNVLANTKDVSFDPRDCQQAAIDYHIREEDVKLRYQSMNAHPDGYDVVLRVLPIGRSEDITPLQDLGYTDQQVEDVLSAAAQPVGSILIAGVTGSGKSTTLKNMIMYINADNGYRQKIYSIEDPPEYTIPRITQIPVVLGKDFDPTKHNPFAKPIKACMRGDPDIIMIGEIRDGTTGDLTKKAIQSGHQVLSTVHTTSALGIVSRLEDFGLSRSVLGAPEFLTALIYQKLLAKVCPHCAINFVELIENNENMTKKDVKMYKTLCELYPDIKTRKILKRNHDGCSHCNYTGIKGRTVCAEIVRLDLRMLELIGLGHDIALRQYWRNLSDNKRDSLNMKGKTAMEHGFLKVLDGISCPFELEGAFGSLSEMLPTDEDKKQRKYV